MINPNIIIIWLGTNATIPSGYSRETTLDGLYPKGTADAVDPNVTGGAASHTHTSSAHSHTLNTHTHSVNTSSDGNNQNSSSGSGSETFRNPHAHLSVPVSDMSGGGLSSVTSTYSSMANDPSYYTVIYIKATGRRPIPSGAAVLWYEEDLPSGFNICNGDGGLTPDLRNKYLKGAGTGADTGDTGGTTTNTHTLTHTHVETAHTHSQTIAGYISTPTGMIATSPGTGFPTLNHSHVYTLSSVSAGSITNPDALVPSEVVEPVYKKVAIIRNTSGVSKIPKRGVVGLWLGTLATIPLGWKICDGTLGTPDLRTYYFKGISTVGEIGNTGGANSHTHASQSHIHTGASHTHANNGSNLNHTLAVNEVGGAQEMTQNSTSPHASLVSISTETTNWGSTNTTADSSSNEPEYRTVAYIMLKNPPVGMIQDA